MKKFNFKKIASIIVFIIIVLLIVYYIRTHWQDFLNIHIVSWLSLIILIFLTPISFWLIALFFKKSVEPYALKLSFNEYFGLTVITLMGNYSIPYSGFGLRAVYMKKVYAFSYRHFLTTVIVNWLTNILIYTLAGLAALAYYYLKIHKIDWHLTIIFLIVMIISLFSFAPIKIKFKNRLLHRLALPFLLWQEYIRNKKTLKELFVLTFYQFIVAVLMFYFAYLTFGFKISVIDSFLPTILALYSSIIRIVPGSLGLYEIAVVYPSKIFGLSVSEGLSVAILTRMVTFFWTFALGLIFSYILIGKGKHREK